MWTSLEHLEIVEKDNLSDPTSLSKLPIYGLLTRTKPRPQLKSLVIGSNNVHLSEEEIQAFPSSLTRLQLTTLNHQLFGALETHLSTC